MKKLIFLFTILLVFTSCNTDDDNGITVNLNEFEAITQQQPYNELKPKETVDYLEIVTYLDESHVDFSSGILCANAENTDDCESQFKGLIPENGYVSSCLPSYCYTFIRFQSAGENYLVSSDEELLDFLGSIDSKSDALLIARANGYYWAINDLENGAIKETSSGYELIVTQLVKDCAPIQVNRYHLKIASDAKINILKEEVASIDENACI